jgi:hypothetical protein
MSNKGQPEYSEKSSWRKGRGTFFSPYPARLNTR